MISKKTERVRLSIDGSGYTEPFLAEPAVGGHVRYPATIGSSTKFTVEEFDPTDETWGAVGDLDGNPVEIPIAAGSAQTTEIPFGALCAGRLLRLKADNVDAADQVVSVILSRWG